ncbi:MAG: MoaD/ThiS family protein [Halobacteriota archaeon]
MPTIKVPAVLSDGGSAEKVDVEGDTVRAAFDAYTDGHGSEIEEKVLDGDEIKEYINVYVNGRDVRDEDGLDTALDEDDEIRIIPAASGGR